MTQRELLGASELKGEIPCLHLAVGGGRVGLGRSEPPIALYAPDSCIHIPTPYLTSHVHTLTLIAWAHSHLFPLFFSPCPPSLIIWENIYSWAIVIASLGCVEEVVFYLSCQFKSSAFKVNHTVWGGNSLLELEFINRNTFSALPKCWDSGMFFIVLARLQRTGFQMKPRLWGLSARFQLQGVWGWCTMWVSYSCWTLRACFIECYQVHEVLVQYSKK